MKPELLEWSQHEFLQAWFWKSFENQPVAAFEACMTPRPSGGVSFGIEPSMASAAACRFDEEYRARRDDKVLGLLEELNNFCGKDVDLRPEVLGFREANDRDLFIGLSRKIVAAGYGVYVSPTRFLVYALGPAQSRSMAALAIVGVGSTLRGLLHRAQAQLLDANAGEAMRLIAEARELLEVDRAE